MTVFLGIAVVVVIVFVAGALSIGISRRKYMNSPLVDDLNVIITRGDNYESAFCSYIESQLMSNPDFVKLYCKENGRKTRYYWKHFTQMYDSVFPFFFEQPTKAKKYAFVGPFADFIKYECKDAKVKDFIKVVALFEQEGFDYTAPDENRASVTNESNETNISVVE